jgi:hypothetical protein
VITRLLDRWWDWRTAAAHRRAATRPVQLPPDLSIDVGTYPLCAREGCGHVADVHRHYRDGNDCSQCDCRSYTSFRRPTHA